MAESASSEALVVSDLHVELHGRSVLHGVSFAARHGELLAVVGPNGAGKSTLLRAVSGLLPYRGEVRSEQRDLRLLDAAERARRISFVPTHTRLSASLAVHEVVSLGRYVHRPALSALRSRASASERQVVQQALQDTDVAHLAERSFSDLSSGEQKRVLLARALCSEARTLLLDEPTSNLDIEHALRLFALLRKLADQGRALVLVLHQLEHALLFCERALLLSAGKTLALGPTREVLTPEHVLSLHRVELVPAGAPGFRLPEAP